MKKRMLFFLVFAIICRLYALDADEVISKTREKYEDLNTFYAEFTQFLCDELSGTCTSFAGKIFFQRPAFFRLEIENPKQIYVGDSTSLWIYMPEKKRAIRQNLGQMPIQITPDIFLKDYNERFNAELVDEGKTNVQIILTPKQEIEIYQRITIEIQREKYEIVGISILDGTGSENKFNFDKIVIDKKISKELFEFHPPKGTEIDEY